MSSVRFAWTVVLLVCCIAALHGAEARTNSLSAIVPAGKEYCFFEAANEGDAVKVSFQVFAGGSLDVNFRWHTADGQEIISDNSQINHGKYAWNSLYTGVSQICFSNTFSSITDKHVFFEVIVGSTTGDENWAKPIATNTASTPTFDITYTSLQAAHENLAEVTRLQAHLRHREARHMYTAEDNNARVFYFSLLECIVLVATSGIQVYFVRQFFANEKKGGI